jgi:hypothetical protein
VGFVTVAPLNSKQIRVTLALIGKVETQVARSPGCTQQFATDAEALDFSGEVLARFGHPPLTDEVLHFALLAQSSDAFQRHLQSARWDRRELIQKIDCFDVQSAQRCARDLPDVVGPAVETIASAVRVNSESNVAMICSRKQQR